MIINLSVWESVEDLHHFVFRTAHTEFLRRRREWFERMDEAFLVCWWIPAGTIPSTEEAVERLAQLRRDGVSDEAFTLARRTARPRPSSHLASAITPANWVQIVATVGKIGAQKPG